MTRLVGVALLSVCVTVAVTLPAGAQTSSTDDGHPATPTTTGTTGLWTVPSADVLPAKAWSVSVQRWNVNDGEGFANISNFPATFAVGLGGRAEVFGSWFGVTRIDRDVRPLFFTNTQAENQAGTGGGVLVDYPLERATFTGSSRGDLWAGGKIRIAGNDEVGLAVRGMVKLPTGNKTIGTTSGKTDFQADVIVTGINPALELSGSAGVIVRGNPSGYTLTNGFRWGAGVAFPQRFSAGFRITAEVFGESYFNHAISAPAGLFGADASPVPTSSGLKNPVFSLVGVTWQAPNGFFVGGAAAWNMNMSDRAAGGGTNIPRDDKDFEIRIGYHPGTGKRPSPSGGGSRPAGGPGGGGPGPGGAPGPGPGAAPRPGGAPGPGAPGPGGPGAAPGGGAAGPGPGAPGAGGPPAGAAPGAGAQVPNRPPTVRASCNPCTVEVGRASTLSADAQDPDGDPLTYQWTWGSGTFATPTARQSAWTAPMQPGSVPFTVTVNDGRGGTASDRVTVQVVQPAPQTYTFEDVHFGFDRFSLTPDALHVLDDAVTAMQQNQGLRITIEGHTCNIGTAEYNLALGDRRARAVRDYLVSRGISADRLTTVSYGEERPKFDNSREETRRLNRRAALVVRVQ